MTEARRRFYQLVSAAALCAAFSGIASADPNTGIIYGRVLLLGTNQPVCPITVTARNDRQPALKTHTLADGSFHFFDVSPGTVDLVIGHDRFARSVLVSANLQNLDAYVNPIYLPSLPRPPLQTLNHVTSKNAIHAEYCGRHTYTGYAPSDYDR